MTHRGWWAQPGCREGWPCPWDAGRKVGFMEMLRKLCLLIYNGFFLL